MTTIDFLQDPADTAVISLLESVENLHVHVGHVTDSDGDAKTISAPLPYVLYMFSMDYATTRRVGGWAGKAKDFAVNFVGGNPASAEAVGRGVRDFLLAQTVVIDGKAHRIHQWNRDDPIMVREDPTWTRPGGGSLHYGRLEFYVTH